MNNPFLLSFRVPGLPLSSSVSWSPKTPSCSTVAVVGLLQDEYLYSAEDVEPSPHLLLAIMYGPPPDCKKRLVQCEDQSA